MRVNIAKCEIMVFAHTAPDRQLNAVRATALRYGGVSIPVKGRARYLGLYYGPATAFDSCYQELIAAGKRASLGLIAALDKKGCRAPDIMHTCFDVQVRSVLSYGVEVWGPDAMCYLFEGVAYGGHSNDESKAMTAKWRKARTLFDKALTDPMVVLQTRFFARAAAVSRPTLRLLYAEFAAHPMQEHWARMILGFWNRTIKQEKSLAHTFLADAVAVAAAVGFEGMCWVSKVYRMCKKLGYDWRVEGPQGTDALCDWLMRTALPVGAIMTDFTGKLMQEWRADCLSTDPRDFPESGGRQARPGAPGVKMSRYTNWMGLPHSEAMIEHGRLAHMSQYVTYGHLIALIRFRLGCWDLEVNRPKAGNVHRPRAQRVCRMCGCGSVEDEKHVLLECASYASLRHAIGITGGDMKLAMLRTPVTKLAAYLHAVMTLRSRALNSVT
jgi:hypothetical protein